MIFRVIVIFSLAVGIHNTYSQTYLGAKLGLSNSWQDSPATTNSIKRGVVFGITASKTISERISLKFDILIAERGYKYRFDDNDLFDQLTSTYLDIPVVLGYSMLSPESQMTLHLNVGGYYGRWLSGKYKSRIVEGSPVLAEEYVFTENFNEAGFKDNRNELGIVGGISLSIPNKSNLITFELRYMHGVNSIHQFEEVSLPDDTYNRSLVLSLAYGFDL